MLVGSLLQYLPKPTQAPKQSLAVSYEGQVVKVTDGDSITILSANNQKVRFRLTGIAAPDADQPFGKESKQSLAAMV
jgi:micrococcal nuclease